MRRIKCSFWEIAHISRYFLRRYNADGAKCAVSGMGCHNAMSAEPIHESKDEPTEDGICCNNPPPAPAGTDPRWPTKCKCGYEFKATDNWQVFGRKVFRNKETGELADEKSLPDGAMWYQDWYGHFGPPGPDGHHLIVKLPGGHDWHVDGEATNCTRKGDKTHKCWVREGVPPNVTAGKQGNTCSAGAGSIAVPGYHGFLRNGYLED